MHLYPGKRCLPLITLSLISLALLSCVDQPQKNSSTGDARFEFLTPSLVRMEYSPSGKFVDAPTAVVQKRDWAAVKVASSMRDGWLTLSTSEMTLRYKLHSGPFTPTNLQVTWNNAGGAHAWHPGEVDTQNLGGLTYSLDHVSKDNLPADDRDSPVNNIIPGIDIPLEKAKPGLLSRSGYALIDDSRTPIWNAQQKWIQPRPDANGQDWYLFTYYHDYQHVFQEYADLCGAIPMIPRYTLGTWVTDFNFEYFPNSAQAQQPDFQRDNQRHLEEELTRLRQNHIPFDTLVLDFAWHNYGWDGGYDWSPLIPHPDAFIKWLQDRGIKLSLNDHPGYAGTDESILSPNDSHAPQVLEDLGRAQPLAPTFDMDISKSWKFSTDPNDQGLSAQWYAVDYRDSRWKHIRTDESWQAQGYKTYDGVAWYRATFTLPHSAHGSLYLWLGDVGKSYRVFVNGQEVKHSNAHWPNRLTYADIASYVNVGEKNVIALRIESGGQGGGILLGPVAIRDVAPPGRIAFDLSDQKQADVFMRDLHEPLMQGGVSVWWVDGGGGAADMPGLNKQLWTNKVFYDFSQQVSGQRGFILSRYGDWGSERYPAFFTGDTYSEWPVLAYEVAFTARGGNVLVPYISHDIGGFHGAKIDFDLYARWIEFGTFSPILRMHSAHANPKEGNVRMPWVYGNKGIELMRKYFTLRTQLIPYMYSYTWQAHTQSMPLLRPLYLAYPDLEQAYQHSHEYFFGDEMLVAPVLDASGDATLYLPPGKWIDFFTGKHYDGDTSFAAHYAVDDTPVFIREGAIIPEQPVSDYSNAKPLDKIVVNVYGSGRGDFDLYEDDGTSLAYQQGQYAMTSMHYATQPDGTHQLVIAPAKGSYANQPASRSYEVLLHASQKPQTITVNGQTMSHWTWYPEDGTTLITLPEQSIRNSVNVSWQ